MPIYEYSCKKCGETIEVIQKMSDPELKKHKGCGGSLTKLISAAGFQFKGAGWYVTDYARKSNHGEKEGHDGAPKKDGEPKESKESTTEKPASTSAKDEGKAAPSKAPANETKSKPSDKKK